jgi:hypothetical protein
MSNPLHDLIRDTLTYLKDPLLPKQSLLTNGKDQIFFQKKPTQPSPVLKFEPLPPPAKVEKKEEHKSEDLKSPIKTMLERIAPSLKLSDQIPNDTTAKRIAAAWKEKIPDAEVILLACDSSSETLDFLKGLAKAIDGHLAKVKILMAERLEEQHRWDLFLSKNNFRLIIASDGVQKFPGLMQFYKSIPANSQFFLDKTPLFVLSSIVTYKSSLEHKAALWKTICQMLKK